MHFTGADGAAGQLLGFTFPPFISPPHGQRVGLLTCPSINTHTHTVLPPRSSRFSSLLSPSVCVCVCSSHVCAEVCKWRSVC